MIYLPELKADEMDLANWDRIRRDELQAARKGHKIITEFAYPPIPDRGSDWSAVFDNYDGAPDAHCPIGRGPTELSAIADLLEQERERVLLNAARSVA